MEKPLISLGMSLIVFTTLLSGCSTSQSASQETPQATELPAVQETKEPVSVITPDVVETNDFTTALLSFLEANGYENQNYIISPTSFRAALALATAGADSDTKTELLSAMGFKDMEELNQWYSSVIASEDKFNKWLDDVTAQYEENKE